MPSSTSPNSSPSDSPDDGLRRLERAAADEDAEPREERLCPSRRAGCSSTRSRRAACPARRRPPVRNDSRFSASRARICSGVISLTRAAASSIASGMPSSRRQISATAVEVPVVELEARLRVLRALDEELHRRRVRAPAPAPGTPSGGTGYSRSPRTRSGARLVARTLSARRAREQLPDQRRRGQHLTRSCRARAASARSPRRSAIVCRERPVGRLADAEHVGDRASRRAAGPAPAPGRRSRSSSNSGSSVGRRLEREPRLAGAAEAASA